MIQLEIEHFDALTSTPFSFVPYMAYVIELHLLTHSSKPLYIVLRGDIRTWLQEREIDHEVQPIHVEHVDFDGTYYRVPGHLGFIGIGIEFDDPEDAVVFKLTFGGA